MIRRLFVLAVVSAVLAPVSRAENNDEAREAAEAWRKLRRGEALTDEERTKLLGRRQGGQFQAGGPRDREAAGKPTLRSGLLVYGDPGELDVRDYALFRLADLDLQAEKVDGALARLTSVLHRPKQSSAARSLAAYNLGVLYLQKKVDMEKAKTFFHQVEGDLSEKARELVVKPLLDQEKREEAVKELEAFLAKAKDAYTKAAIIRQIEKILTEAGDAGKLATFLGRVPTLITKKEAAEAAKKEATKAKPGQDMGQALGNVVQQWRRNWGNRGRGRDRRGRDRRPEPRQPDKPAEPDKPKANDEVF